MKKLLLLLIIVAAALWYKFHQSPTPPSRYYSESFAPIGNRIFSGVLPIPVSNTEVGRLRDLYGELQGVSQTSQARASAQRLCLLYDAAITASQTAASKLDADGRNASSRLHISSLSDSGNFFADMTRRDWATKMANLKRAAMIELGSLQRLEQSEDLRRQTASSDDSSEVNYASLPTPAAQRKSPSAIEASNPLDRSAYAASRSAGSLTSGSTYYYNNTSSPVTIINNNPAGRSGGSIQPTPTPAPNLHLK